MHTSPRNTAVAVVALALALSGCGDGDAAADDASGTTGSSRAAPSGEAAPSGDVAPSGGVAPSSDAPRPSGPAVESSPGSSAAPTPATVRLTDGVWTLSDVTVERGTAGDTISARVSNDGPEGYTGLFALRIYAPGSQIAEVRGSADLEAGGTAVVTFDGAEEPLPGDPATYTYEFVVEATL